MLITDHSHQDLIVGEDIPAGEKVGLNEPNIVVRRTDEHVLFGYADIDLKIGQKARLQRGSRVVRAD